jgi:hydrogenase nickel incorporation protein HypB
MSPRIVEVRRDLLRKNDLLARELRERFSRAGTFVVSMVSSPGAGKTALLEETLRRLRGVRRVAALVGDLATENDAARLGRTGTPVRQILTGTVCHLDAQMVGQALDAWDVGQLDVLFIENVGNLVCPASYDLGENLRAVLMSVTEGEDKPLKYPTIFNTADVVVITKVDMAEPARFDGDLARHNIREVRPDVEIVEVSTFTGHGLDRWLRVLNDRMSVRRSGMT